MHLILKKVTLKDLHSTLVLLKDHMQGKAVDIRVKFTFYSSSIKGAEEYI